LSKSNCSEMPNGIDIKNKSYGAYDVDGKNLPNQSRESGNSEENKWQPQVYGMGSTIAGYTPEEKPDTNTKNEKTTGVIRRITPCLDQP